MLPINHFSDVPLAKWQGVAHLTGGVVYVSLPVRAGVSDLLHWFFERIKLLKKRLIAVMIDQILTYMSVFYLRF